MSEKHETVGDRIKAAREAKGWKQHQLADACGWGQSRIGNYERDASAPKAADIQLMAHALGISPSYIQFGATVVEAREPISQYDAKYALVRKYAAQASAGSGAQNEHEEIDGKHAYRRDWLERKNLNPMLCVVVEADGDSMYPTIHDGDQLLVNRGQRKLINGHVFAFRTDDGVKVKRLHKQLDGKVRVVSDNPDKMMYPDDYLTPYMEAEIIGEVVHRSGGV
jgi:phage repressor protein C with HTH and peptisase S24 domain